LCYGLIAFNIIREQTPNTNDLLVNDKLHTIVFPCDFSIFQNMLFMLVFLCNKSYNIVSFGYKTLDIQLHKED